MSAEEGAVGTNDRPPTPLGQTKGRRSALSRADRVLRILVPIVSLDLVIQYVAGMGTNAYAPGAGFTSNTDFGIFDLHWMNGFALAFLSMALVVVAVLSRRVPNIAASVVVLASVVVAGLAGETFVGTTPNPSWATFTMGLAFLVAFGAALSFAIRLRIPVSIPPTPSGTSPPA